MEARRVVSEYVVDVGEAICVPLRNTLYPATATLSVEAVHERLIWVLEVTFAVSPVGTVGAVVSGGVRVLALTAVDWAELFPAAS